MALEVFEFAQTAAQIWRGSKVDQKREILEAVSLNRTLGDVTLVVEKRKSFDELAKRLEIQLSRDDRTRTPLKNAGKTALSQGGDVKSDAADGRRGVIQALLDALPAELRQAVVEALRDADLR